LLPILNEYNPGFPFWLPAFRYSTPSSPFSTFLKHLSGPYALAEAAKLPKQRFHDLRHACISLLGAQGLPLKVIAEIIGHPDVRLTQNAYQHVYQEAKPEAAAKMDALLSGVAAKHPPAHVY
jgi:integrase